VTKSTTTKTRQRIDSAYKAIGLLQRIDSAYKAIGLLVAELEAVRGEQARIDRAIEAGRTAMSHATRCRDCSGTLGEDDADRLCRECRQDRGDDEAERRAEARREHTEQRAAELADERGEPR